MSIAIALALLPSPQKQPAVYDQMWELANQRFHHCMQTMGYPQRQRALEKVVRDVEAMRWEGKAARSMPQGVFEADREYTAGAGYYFLGQSEKLEGHWTLAKPHFDKAYGLVKSNAEYLRVTNGERNRAKRSGVWVELQTTMLNIMQGQMDVAYRLRNSSVCLDKLDEILELLRLISLEKRFFETHPLSKANRGLYFNTKGLILAEDSHYESARMALNLAYVDFRPLSMALAATASMNIGDTYYMEERWDLVRSFYEKALQEAPKGKVVRTLTPYAWDFDLETIRRRLAYAKAKIQEGWRRRG